MAKMAHLFFERFNNFRIIRFCLVSGKIDRTQTFWELVYSKISASIARYKRVQTSISEGAIIPVTYLIIAHLETNASWRALKAFSASFSAAFSIARAQSMDDLANLFRDIFQRFSGRLTGWKTGWPLTGINSLLTYLCFQYININIENKVYCYC